MLGDSSSDENGGMKPGGRRLLHHANYGDGSAAGAGAADAEDPVSRGWIEGDVLLETEHVLLRCAPELIHYVAEIRVHGRTNAAHESLPTGFNRYRVCLSPEARNEILRALRAAASRCDPGGMRHLFRLVVFWEDLCQR